MTFGAVLKFPSPSGARLALRHQPASGPGRAVLLIQHGLAEHAGRYRPFAEFMARRGFHVYAHDHRGHGMTEADDAPRGVFAGSDGVGAVLRDCLAVREEAARRHPGLPIIVFGHSMGGLIALNYAESFPGTFDALAVWNANFDGGVPALAARMVLSLERMLLGSDVPSPTLPRLTFEAWDKRVGGGSAFDWLSTRPEAVAAYRADPLCGFRPSVSMWRDIFEMIRRGSRPDSIGRVPPLLPVHLAGGGADPSTANGQAVRRLADRLRRSGLADVTLRIHDDLRHETLNEVDADTVMSEFAMWATHATVSATITQGDTVRANAPPHAVAAGPRPSTSPRCL